MGEGVNAVNTGKNKHRQGRSYIYTKTQVRTHLDQNMGIFFHSSDGFLMLCVQDVCL